MAGTSKTLADLGITVEEWARNQRMRGYSNLLTTTRVVKGLKLAQRETVELAINTRLELIRVLTATYDDAKAVRVKHSNGLHYIINAEDLERSVAPTGIAVSQIRSGNSHLLQPHARIVLKSRQAALTDADPQPTEVRVAVHDIDVQWMDGSVDTVSGGTIFDVCRSRTKGFCVLRTEDGQIAPFHDSELQGMSVLQMEGVDQHIDHITHTNFALDRCDMQILLVSHKKVYGMGRLGQLLPVEEGTKVLLTSSCNGIDFFLNTSGELFILTEDQTNEALFNMDAEETVLGDARRAGFTGEVADCTPGGWSTHQHHNDRVTSGTTTMVGIVAGALSTQDITNLPRNREGLPLPPTGYAPPQQFSGLLATQFGHYDFNSFEDRVAAKAMGISMASDVVWQAHRGKEGLSDIKLRWIPGTLEGTQAPFGQSNAYVMITIINDMRLWHFGEGPVPHDELPIFCGLDDFWHEREGADVSELHRFPRNSTVKPLLTEAAVESQMYDRQGFVGRAMRPAQSSLNFHANPTPAARALQREILRASDRSWQLGEPIERPPIDDSAPPKERTTTHPYFVHVDYHQALPDVLYLYHKGADRASAKVLSSQVFKAGKSCIAALEHKLPLLNAYGEARSTIVKGQDKSTREILISDMPHVPARIASNEWHLVLGAMLVLGLNATPWNMLMARMPQETRSYCNWYQSIWLDNARRYRLVPDKTLNNRNSRRQDAIIQANPIPGQLIAANTVRGIAPGPVDPTLAYGQVVFDHSGRLHPTNWVDFPPDSTDEHHPKDRFAKLNSGRSSRESRIKQARVAKVAEQTRTAGASNMQAVEAENEDEVEELEEEELLVVQQADMQHASAQHVSSQHTATQQVSRRQSTVPQLPVQPISATAEDYMDQARVRASLEENRRRDSVWNDTATLGADDESTGDDIEEFDDDEEDSFNDEDEASAANYTKPGSCPHCGEYHAPQADCFQY